MATVSKERLAEVFVEVADTLVGDFDLVEFLQKVTSYTSDLADTRAAGLLLAGPQGRLQLMAASDERAQMVELFQVQAHEGPCQDCYRTGEPVVNADLSDAENKWPRFAPRATAAGYRSVHAFPLKLRDQVIGALNLFGTEVGKIDPADVRIVQSLADIATIGILQERAIRNSETLTEQLQGALNSRVVIEQAKGMLAQIHGVTPDQGFEQLRSYCRSHSARPVSYTHLTLPTIYSV